MRYAIERLLEASTWRGIIALLMSLGLTINPDQAVAIVTAGVGVIGAIGAFVPDSDKEKNSEQMPAARAGDQKK